MFRAFKSASSLSIRIPFHPSPAQSAKSGGLGACWSQDCAIELKVPSTSERGGRSGDPLSAATADCIFNERLPRGDAEDDGSALEEFDLT